MGALISRLSTFLSDLKRRHVFRVAVAYGGAAFVILQLADIILPKLPLPAGSDTFVLILLGFGFVVSLSLAWAFDITTKGVQRTESHSRTENNKDRDDQAAETQPKPPVDAEYPRSSRISGHDRVESPPGGKSRLIVLPFRMIRPDAEIDFLSFSLPDAITSSLSGLQSLVIRSHLAALRFAGDTPALATIAEEADVDIVLTGTLLRVSNQLRVITELTDARDGTLLWSQTSQVALGDLFELQDQLTRRIIESLELPLTARERQILRHDVPATARAYEFYLRANQLAYVVGQWRTARDLYLQGLEEDPNYAPAWARLARCYRLIAKWSDNESVIRENQESAEAAFQRALLINPDLGLAHNLYAQLEVELGRAEKALVRLVSRASSSGGDPELFGGLVHVCRFCGLLEASLAAHTEARRLDSGAMTSVHHTHFMLGDYVRVLDDTSGDIGYIAPLALAMLGRDREAIAMLRRNEERCGRDRVLLYLVSLRAMLEGHRGESLAALDRVTPTIRDPEALYYIVRQFAKMGEVDRAINEFERVVEMGFFCFSAMKCDPWLSSLRGRERFAKALRRAELRHNAAADAFARAGGDSLLPMLALAQASFDPRVKHRSGAPDHAM